ncbi:MAG: hypothetical protein JNL83_25255 [Myxococcales bacterium]|nr:hypothetical protein [Myxococcales bacterium]
MPLKKIDMSPQAVAARIEDLRALYRLMLSLRAVKILGPLPASTGKARSGS